MTEGQFNRLKIGDKVLIRKDLIPDERYGCNTFVDNMTRFSGKEVTILDFSERKPQFHVLEEHGIYWYTLEMIDFNFKFGR